MTSNRLLDLTPLRGATCPPKLNERRRKRRSNQTSSFRDGPKDQTSDVQLHIGESRDSGLDASHRPGMTAVGLLREARHRAVLCADPLARNVGLNTPGVSVDYFSK